MQPRPPTPAFGTREPIQFTGARSNAIPASNVRRQTAPGNSQPHFDPWNSQFKGQDSALSGSNVQDIRALNITFIDTDQAPAGRRKIAPLPDSPPCNLRLFDFRHGLTLGFLCAFFIFVFECGIIETLELSTACGITIGTIGALWGDRAIEWSLGILCIWL